MVTVVLSEHEQATALNALSAIMTMAEAAVLVRPVPLPGGYSANSTIATMRLMHAQFQVLLAAVGARDELAQGIAPVGGENSAGMTPCRVLPAGDGG